MTCLRKCYVISSADGILVSVISGTTVWHNWLTKGSFLLDSGSNESIKRQWRLWPSCLVQNLYFYACRTQGRCMHTYIIQVTHGEIRWNAILCLTRCLCETHTLIFKNHRLTLLSQAFGLSSAFTHDWVPFHRYAHINQLWSARIDVLSWPYAISAVGK